MGLANILPTERKQSQDDLRCAHALQPALALGPELRTVAAYNLGQVYQLLLQFEDSVKYLRRPPTSTRPTSITLIA